MTNLVERDAQLAQLRACGALAAGGSGNVVLVSGEAGIGKTSLVKEFASRSQGTPVWWGSCDALHDLARLRRQAGEARKHQVLHAARQLVEAMAQQLGHEERIPAGAFVQAGGRAQCIARERAHRLPGKTR